MCSTMGVYRPHNHLLSIARYAFGIKSQEGNQNIQILQDKLELKVKKPMLPNEKDFHHTGYNDKWTRTPVIIYKLGVIQKDS